MVNAVVVVADPDRRSLMRGLLHLQHHRVVAEGEAAEMLPKLGALEGIDLLVLDEEGPAGAWRAFAEEARRLRPSIRVVLITPRETPALEKRARAAGVAAILQRPFQVSEFQSALEAPLDRSGAYRTSPGHRTRAK